MAMPLDPTEQEIPANLRSFYSELHGHLRETERKYHQAFILFITATVGFLALMPDRPSLSVQDAWLWFVLFAFATVTAAYMGLLLNWKRRYHRRLRRLTRHMQIPQRFNPFRSRGRGADIVLLYVVIVIGVANLALGSFVLLHSALHQGLSS